MLRAAPLLLLAVFGCTPDAARAALTTTAYATVQADKLFADAYRIASTQARDSSATQAEKDQKMVAWDAAVDKVVPIIEALYAGLTTAALALDAAEQTHDYGEWDQEICGLSLKLREVAKVLDERGLKTPPALAKVLALSAGLPCAGAL